MTALVDAIVRIGQLAADRPDIAELDVNPLLVLPEGRGWWRWMPESSWIRRAGVL